MKFIEEIVVEEFLPTVRSMLADALAEAGLTQREIADAIGVSQSAVSKYIHGEVERHPEILGDERVQETVDELAEGLASGTMDDVGALVELEVLIRTLEAPGELLARMHEREVPGLRERAGPFRIHDPESEIRQREQVRASVRRAIGRLERAPGFADLLPQVGANVVEILPQGDRVEDVAGVPGRIIDVEGAVEIPGEPAFGVSGHLAGILIAARAGGSDKRAAINIRYSEAIVDALRADGLQVLEVPGEADIRAAVREAVGATPAADAIAQTGGFGVEPVTYLLADDAAESVDQALTLVDQ